MGMIYLAKKVGSEITLVGVDESKYDSISYEYLLQILNELSVEKNQQLKHKEELFLQYMEQEGMMI